ncbi:hypothetical protein FBZ93_105372 [Bradyrhizobium macuxiense]|uniref:Uncharacterized protein n=1 Tax=Bradyrhizobium macuxiense TaxID=1755647 RepID=A0A560LYP4_9BRAD|nr:hypothetical protein FBZ93_105372 [Bradyrhizobium macuxiense]
MHMLTVTCSTFEHDVEVKGRNDEKKPGSAEPGLRYWPREADTITFQEGLLNFRATGGGGHMRDATAQRGNTMIPIDAMQQLSRSHVSHAETGGSVNIPINRPYKAGLIRTASAAPC